MPRYLLLLSNRGQQQNQGSVRLASGSHMLAEQYTLAIKSTVMTKPDQIAEPEAVQSSQPPTALITDMINDNTLLSKLDEILPVSIGLEPKSRNLNHVIEVLRRGATFPEPHMTHSGSSESRGKYK